MRRVRWRTARTRLLTPHVGVVGAGAIGTIVAARLARICHVTLFVRTPTAAERLAVEGLHVNAEPRRFVTASADPADAARCEALVVAVKTTATASLAPFAPFAPRLVLTLQNGLGNAALLRAALGDGGEIALGPTTIGGTRLAEGRVANATAGTTTFGCARGAESGGALARLARTFEAAGLPVRLVEDVAPAVWSKFVISCAINALAALHRVPNGALLEAPALRMRLDALARESAAVARALGVDVPDATTLVHAAIRATAANRNSLLQDLDAGRPTEIGALNGALVAAGLRASVPTPEHDRLLAEFAANVRDAEAVRAERSKAAGR